MEAVDAFKQYYGEDRIWVDDNNRMIVYWPEVTVTNEVNESTVIKELYARVRIDNEGSNLVRGNFELARAYYTKEQAVSGYTHSHIPTRTELGYWGHPCLGFGPIRNTISALHNSDDFDRWQLYCWELDKYVHVESFNGGPYIKLRTIGSSSKRYIKLEDWNIDFSKIRIPHELRDFIPYFLEKNGIRVAANDKYYLLGDNLTDVVLDMSRCFIEWFNENKPCSVEHLLQKNIIEKTKIENDRIMLKECLRYNNGNIMSLNGRSTQIIFKGETKILVIEDIRPQGIENAIYILRHDIVMYLVNTIINLINYGAIIGREFSERTKML